MQHLARLMRLPDAEIDLALAALLIAQEEYPELDVRTWLDQLDAMATEVKKRLRPDIAPAEAAGVLSGWLAGEQGFRGNQDEYYDPRNSFLNDVLERRTGIPISLSVVYVAVGRRAGLDVAGVGFPAHFLARCEGILLDPFGGGRILTDDDCRALLARASGSSVPFQARFLEATPAKQIVTRMLTNLKHIYVNARYYRKAIGVIDRLLAVDTKAYRELRDRGIIHAELKQYGQARADLEACLERCTQPEEVFAVRKALKNIEDVMTLMDS